MGNGDLQLDLTAPVKHIPSNITSLAAGVGWVQFKEVVTVILQYCLDAIA